MSLQRHLGGLFLLLAALAAGGAAQAEELYTVSNVEVEVTAADAAQAREAAIALGQSRALQRLWARLIPAERLDRAPSLSAERISELIEDFRVAEERSGEDSYAGRLTVSFRPAEVRRILRDADVPYAEQRGRPLLLLPLFADEAGTRLWDDPNPWRRAWQQYREVGLVPVIVPLGDLGDIGAIDARRAEALDRDALDAIAAVHDAAEVLVTIARLTGDPASGEAGLSIELRRLGPGRDGGMEMESLRQREGEPAERFYRRAVENVNARIQEEWKSENQLRFDSRDQLLVRVPLRGLEDWVEVRRRLDATASIVEVDILHLSLRRAVLGLAYVGEESQLGRRLAQHGLGLQNEPSDTLGMPSRSLRLGIDPRTPPAPGQEDEEEDAGAEEEPGDRLSEVRLPLGLQ